MYHLLSWGQIKSICLFMYSLDNILRRWWLLNCLITVNLISIQITVSGATQPQQCTCEENNPSCLVCRLSLFAHYSSSCTRPAPSDSYLARPDSPPGGEWWQGLNMGTISGMASVVSSSPGAGYYVSAPEALSRLFRRITPQEPIITQRGDIEYGISR